MELDTWGWDADDDGNYEHEEEGDDYAAGAGDEAVSATHVIDW